MFYSNISIIKNEDNLLIDYAPESGFLEICNRLKEGYPVKQVFFVDEKSSYYINEEEGCITFEIAKSKSGFYLLDKYVFNISHNIYIEQKLNISHKWFVAHSKSSIMKRIDELIDGDLYIVEKEIDGKSCLPVSVFMELINVFPNSYEVRKYVSSRISYLLSNYAEGVWKHKESYERYLNKKESNLDLGNIRKYKPLGYEMYKEALVELKHMLTSTSSYNENKWQERIYEIICIIFPKYIANFREIEIGSDNRHNKKPDFLLVDSSGFIDILEIKKPDKFNILSASEVRENYVASRDLAGAIAQIEKYVYVLNHEGEHRVLKLQKIMESDLPEGLNVKVVNPQGILLLGRSNNMTKDQLFDFEIIKRQHKNIIDIMTYDDLYDRLKNIVQQMES